MKIVQNPFFRSCAAPFWPNRIFERQSCQNRHTGQTVRFSWKLYKTLFSGHAQHVLAKSSLWASNFSKSLNLSQILSEEGKQCAFHENCTKPFFQVMRSTVLAKSHLSVKVVKIVTLAWNSLQNGKTVRFPWKLYKTLFSGQAQHVLAKSNLWASKLSKSSHWPEILSKKGRQCAFHESCTKPPSSGHAQHVLAKSHFWASKFSKSWNSPQTLFKM